MHELRALWIPRARREMHEPRAQRLASFWSSPPLQSCKRPPPSLLTM